MKHTRILSSLVAAALALFIGYAPLITVSAEGIVSSAPSAQKDISGDYSVTGQNADGGGSYSGALMIRKRGQVYQLGWNTAGTIYNGVGVQTGNTVAAAFAEGDQGRGCGVVLYQILKNGSLAGKAGYFGKNAIETESATRVSGTDLVGDYTLAGTSPEGKSYTGRLTARRNGQGYKFVWDTGSTLTGFGVQQGDKVAVGFGGSQCGFVSYEVRSNGSLNGQWGYGSGSLGTELAIKR